MNHLRRDNIDILKFSVIGNVDDGKSTLIGRLLYDSKSIMEDQLTAIEELSKRRGEGLNLALLTDGLKAEREQGITIDVAHRYFTTLKRKFIIHDCPGHIQYTRNMITGTSNANLCVLLVDARNGVVEQTRRHTFIASLMQVKHLIICINKMDMVEYAEATFAKIKQDFLQFTSKLSIPDIQLIPISALTGENVVERSPNMNWYSGPTLLYSLENVYIGGDNNYVDSRFPVQKVIRPSDPKLHDVRHYAGRVEGGVFKPGDEVMVLPSGFKTKIKSIQSFDDQQIKEAFFPMSVSMEVEDDLDISRGDMLVKEDNQPRLTQELDIMFCWMGPEVKEFKGKYWVKHTTNTSRCLIKEIKYKIDINTLHRREDILPVKMNDIGRATLRLSKPIFVDDFARNKNTGSIIIIDEQTNQTVAAGMIRS